MQVFRHLQHASRGLWKNRGLTSIILLTLALGIGANTAIFTVAYATLLAPVPYPHPQQLVTVWTGTNPAPLNASPQTFIDWKTHSQAFQQLSAFAGGTFDIAQTNQPENVWGMRVTANYYGTLGASFFLGRDFLSDEDQSGRNHIVILTHKLWSHLGADPNVVGHTLRIEGEPYTVVGVLQPGVADRDIFQMAVPLVFTPEELHHGSLNLVVVGRLKTGVSMHQAQERMSALMAHLAPSEAKSDAENSATVRPLREYMFSLSRDSRQMLLWLLGGVGLVLLIACANIANLLLAKGITRQRELAVRLALGATQRRIFLQLLEESLLLAAAGGMLGTGLGYAMLRALLATMPQFTLPWATDTRLNLPVLLFTFSAATIAGLFFGCLPAWFASQSDPGKVLKGAGHLGLGTGRHRLQAILVIGEFALALSVLTGAGLSLHSFANLTSVDTGVRTDHVLTFYISVPKPKQEHPEQTAAYYRQMLSRIQAVPGVSFASAQTGTPLFPPHLAPFAIAGEFAPDSDPARWLKAGFGAATTDSLKTFGIPLIKGRSFSAQDSPSSVKVG